MSDHDRHEWHGGCHCRNISLSLRTSKTPDELWVRVCTCSYCLAQGARYTSDPDGEVLIKVADASKLLRYRMGHNTADFLTCTGCGVYIGAYMRNEGRPLSVINVNALDRRNQFERGEPVSYAGETVQSRLERRNQRWTPACLQIMA